MLPSLTVGGPWLRRWKTSGDGREREVIEIRGGDDGRSLGLKLELEGGREGGILWESQVLYAEEEIEYHCEVTGREGRPREVR